MEKLDSLRGMLKDYKRSSGKDPKRDHCVVVDVAGANLLLRELFFSKLPKGVTVTEEADELFQVDGIPVRLRYSVPYGSAWIVMEKEIPNRTCCDSTAMSVLLTCFAKGANT